MTENTTRRTVVRGAAWSVPVVSFAAAAPAYATSALLCRPTAACKCPGEGKNTKDYTVRPNCASTQGGVTKVEVYDEVRKRWVLGTDNRDGSWLVRGLNDSRRNRQVRITDTYQSSIFTIPFAPC